MEDLSSSFSKASIAGDVAADDLAELLKMMQNNNMSAMSVTDLIDHLASLKVEKARPDSSSFGSTEKMSTGQANPDLGSPDFSFKSPSNVFTPFKINSSRSSTRQNKSNGLSFGSSDDDEIPSRAPTESGTVPTNVSTQGSQQNIKPGFGSFYGMARNSIPNDVEGNSRPGTSESNVFTNAGLSSLNAASKDTMAAPNVQFNLGGSGKSDGAKRATSRGGGAKAAKTFSDGSNLHRAAGGTAAGPSLGDSWFWGADAASTAPAGPPAATVPAFSSNPAAAASTVLPGLTSVTSATSSAPIQPFTFTIGSDGTTTKRRASASSSTTTTKPVAQPVPSGPFSAAPGPAAVPPAGSTPAAFTSSASAATAAAASSFNVYSLGDHDILHSLQEDYGSPAASDSGDEGTTGKGPFSSTHQAGAEESAEFMDTSSSAAQSPMAPPLNPHPVPTAPAPFVFPATTTASAFASTSSAAESEGQRPQPFNFLFNGQSAAASMSQVEKEPFSGSAAFDGASFGFSIGSKDSKGSSGGAGSSKLGSAAGPAPSQPKPSSANPFDPEATFQRVSQAFAGLAFAAGTTPNPLSASTPAFPTEPPAAAPTVGQVPLTPSLGLGQASKPAQAGAPYVPPLFSTAAPDFTKTAPLPNLAPGGSAAGGLGGLGATFNIGAATTSGPSSSRRPAKASPGKRTVGSSAKTTSSSGADTSATNSIAGDAPPKWWTDAKAAAEARQHAYGLPTGPGENAASGKFTMHGDLLPDSDSDFSDDEGDMGSDDWEDSMNLRPGEGMMMDDDDAWSDEEREELSTARGKAEGHRAAGTQPASARSRPSTAGAPKSPAAARQSPRPAPNAAPHVAASPRKAASAGADAAAAAAVGATGSARPATSAGSRPSTAAPSAPSAGTAAPFSSSGGSSSPRPQTASTGAKAEGSSSSRRKEDGHQQSEASMAHLAELYSKQGKDLYSSGSYARALDAYNKCLNLAPAGWQERATALGNRAAVLVMLHRFKEAVNDCEEALRLDKAMVKLQVRRGRALLRLGFLSPAEDAFRTVLGTEVRDLLSAREMLDLDLVASTSASLDANKSNAQLGVKDAAKVRESIRMLTVLEGQSKYKEALKVCGDILKLSPYYRIAHVSKATSMCELLQYDECKAYIDDLVAQTHGSIQSLHAHPSAAFPTCAASSLQWKESAAEKCVRCDLPAIIGFVLCAGSDLAVVYLAALKNIALNRAYSADIMAKLGTLLRGLASKLAADELRGDWSWVQQESDKITCLLSLKASADEKFKAKNFKAAMLSYTNALKVDPSARKWNAILYSNRAAAHMSLGMHSDAVLDCNQAILKDPDFAKAFLRRARAYRTLNKQAESVRDYRKYLATEPTPSDYGEVHAEMGEFIEQRKREMKQPPPPPSSGARQQYGARPGSGSGGSSSGAGAHGSSWGAGKGPHPYASQSTHNQYWREQNEDFYEKFEQFKNHQSSGGYGGGHPFNRFSGTGSTGSGRSHSGSGGYAGYGHAPGSSWSGSRAGNQQGRRTYHSRASGDYYNFLESDEEESEDEVYVETKKGGEPTHYATLGIAITATEKEIKTAYRKLALQFHPDRNKDPGAEEKFKIIGTAYSTLVDKTTRRQYDLTLPMGRGRR